MLKIYVAGPYSADNVIDVLKNIGRGEKICAQLFKMGFAPFCPWHDRSYVMDNPDDKFTVEQFYEFSLAWLEVSDAMLLIEGWQNSKGTLKECEFAASRAIPIFTDIQDLVEWKERIEGE